MITSQLLQAQQGASSFAPILMMVALFAVFYFFIIRPQQKRQKEIRKFQNSIETGTRVMLQTGIYGKVKSVDLTQGTIEVEIAKGVVVTVNRSMVFADTTNPQEIAKA